MKNNLKKLLGGLCAMAVSASMFSGVVFADETESAFALPEADLVYTMINDPSTPDSELVFLASTYMAQGLLGDVVYQLLSYSDADPNSAFFQAANELMDAPTADILGVEDETAVDENAKEETEVVSTTVTKHTYELDKAAGLTSEDAVPETYGEATSIVQEFKSGTKTLSKIVWDFNLPMGDGTGNKTFSIAAVADGKEDGGENYQEFQLPNIDVNGEFKIGIVLNGWVPEGDTAEVTDTDFVTTSFEYAESADTADVTENTEEQDNTASTETDAAGNTENTDADTAETVNTDDTEAEADTDADTAAESETAEPAADAE